MRHRASRPLADFLHRLPRATAYRLERAAQRLPVRTLVGLMVTAILGIGGYAAYASVTDGSTTHATDTANPPAVRSPESPDLTSQAPESDDQSPDGSSPESDDSRSTRPDSPSPSDVTSPTESESESESETGTPSTDPTRPSPSSPESGSTSPRRPADNAPPNTSLSEEYPEPDGARFSFSATEDATFTCSLDGAAYTSCASPTTYSDLESGWHTFAVRAEDASGNVDPSPAETRWHVKGGHSGDE